MLDFLYYEFSGNQSTAAVIIVSMFSEKMGFIHISHPFAYSKCHKVSVKTVLNVKNVLTLATKL